MIEQEVYYETIVPVEKVREVIETIEVPIERIIERPIEKLIEKYVEVIVEKDVEEE